jgi:hypothetical protein
LAALVNDTVCELTDYTDRKEPLEHRRKLASEAARRRRMLGRKLANARASLKDLRNYAQCLDSLHGMQSIGDAARECLKRLNVPLRKRTFEPLGSSSDNPTAFGMVRLYWFFGHGCRLSGDESEVRVALIRNAFWREFGVETVPYRAKYEDAQSKGCEAVHVVVNRFR